MDAQNMRQMVEAPKDRTPILAKIRDDLGAFFPHYGFGGPDEYAGRFVVVHHPGLAEDGFDIGWSLSGPFGHGLGTDAVFAGWWPLPGSVPATEHDRLMAEKDAEIARLREALTPSAETKAAYWSEVECDCPTETWRHYVPWTSIKQIMKMIRARAALKGDSDE